MQINNLRCLLTTQTCFATLETVNEEGDPSGDKILEIQNDYIKQGNIEDYRRSYHSIC